MPPFLISARSSSGVSWAHGLLKVFFAQSGSDMHDLAIAPRGEHDVDVPRLAFVIGDTVEHVLRLQFLRAEMGVRLGDASVTDQDVAGAEHVRTEAFFLGLV